VRRSLLLWWIAIAAVVLSDLLALVLPAHSVGLDLLNFAHPGSAPVQSSGSTVFALVMQVIAWTVWILLVRGVSLGSNGARWWLTILAMLEDLGLLAAIAGDLYRPTVASLVLGVLSIGIFVVVLLAIIAMHKPTVTLYFQRLT
jgi:hypothetical protein